MGRLASAQGWGAGCGGPGCRRTRGARSAAAGIAGLGSTLGAGLQRAEWAVGVGGRWTPGLGWEVNGRLWGPALGPGAEGGRQASERAAGRQRW